MAGADAGIVTGLSASIAEVKDSVMQANQVVESMKVEFSKMMFQLDEKLNYQGQSLGAADTGLQAEITSVRTTVENFTQSYDPNTPVKMIELYKQAKDQIHKTEVTQQAADALYIQMQGILSGCQSMHDDMAVTKLEVERLQTQAAEAVQALRVSVLSIDVVQGTEKTRVDQVVKDLDKLEAVVRRFDTRGLQKELGKVDEMLTR